MKKAFLILGAVAVSAAAGGLTAWAVAGSREGSVQYIEREVERTPALGTQFTSYQAEQYPDYRQDMLAAPLRRHASFAAASFSSTALSRTPARVSTSKLSRRS